MSCAAGIAKVRWNCTIMEYRVTPGRIGSYNAGVMIWAGRPVLLLNMKKMFDAPLR